MNDEEFISKLKALCLKYDLKNGESYEATYAGREIFEAYCYENGIECDYLKELYELEEDGVDNSPSPEIEYFISDEEIKTNDLVCDGYSPYPIGVVLGMIGDDYVVAGNPDSLIPIGTIVVKTPIKKLDVREKLQ